MPIYEYRCQDCSYQFELLRRMVEANEAAACPHCESRKTTKVIVNVNAFIGSGVDRRSVASGCGACASASSSACSSCRTS